MRPEPAVSLGGFVAAAPGLLVQPRMGFGPVAEMRAGLLATKHANAHTVGTITVDSYTRQGDWPAARRAVAAGGDGLNGYPIAAHPVEDTRRVLDGVLDASFPVQVRHGCANPRPIITAMTAVGLDATEGGPVSYCLPYGRTPLRTAVRDWAECAELLAARRGPGCEPHVETFGGCMLGQLCPPGLLVALSVLEALFLTRHGVRSVSLSYAQQTNAEQDAAAVHALRVLAADLLPGVDQHVVLYTYMGVFPSSVLGARALLAESARLAVRAGARRLIVKTVAEAHRIPTVAENVAALELAARAAADTTPADAPVDTQVLAEARALVHAVLDLHDDIDVALLTAFALGYLDVPYCLHPDNAGNTRARIDTDGRLRWTDLGALPVAGIAEVTGPPVLGARELLSELSYMQRQFDAEGVVAR
jgi:methylaspartate mutase epsilon subunit